MLLVSRRRTAGREQQEEATMVHEFLTTHREEFVSRCREKIAKRPQVPAEIGATAEKHGNEFFRKGFTVDQVVHDYGDLCQSVTELAAERKAPITVDEFRTAVRDCLSTSSEARPVRRI
jgi:hypothetical protein